MGTSLRCRGIRVEIVNPGGIGTRQDCERQARSRYGKDDRREWDERTVSVILTV